MITRLPSSVIILICVREDMNAMIEELGCDKEYAAGLLRAIADGYED
jgi:hypothetical protein